LDDAEAICQAQHVILEEPVRATKNLLFPQGSTEY